MDKKYTPFSKRNVIYARFEAYAFTIVLLLYIWFEKDISVIGTALLGLSWGGYKLLQSLYIKMAEREHLEEIRQGRLHDSLCTDDLDEKIETVDATEVADDQMEVY